MQNVNSKTIHEFCLKKKKKRKFSQMVSQQGCPYVFPRMISKSVLNSQFSISDDTQNSQWTGGVWALPDIVNVALLWTINMQVKLEQKTTEQISKLNIG